MHLEHALGTRGRMDRRVLAAVHFRHVRAETTQRGDRLHVPVLGGKVDWQLALRRAGHVDESANEWE